jgi:hypothetical protein
MESQRLSQALIAQDLHSKSRPSLTAFATKSLRVVRLVPHVGHETSMYEWCAATRSQLVTSLS